MTTAVRVTRPLNDPNSRLLQWRVLLAAFMTATSLLLHYLSTEPFAGGGLIMTIFMLYLSIGLAWMASWMGAPTKLLVAVQLGCDIAAIALLVHYSGGPHSAFPLLFCVTIILGATYHGSRAALILAAAAAIFTGGGHFGLAVGWLSGGAPAGFDYTSGQPVVVTVVHLGLFLAIGLVSGGLARSLARRRLIQHKTRAQFQRTRNEVRNILDHLSSGLITVDYDGLITRVNPAACTILGLEEVAMVGRPICSAVGAARSELADCVQSIATGGTPVNRGEITIRRDGEAVPLGLTVNHLEDADKAINGAVAIFTDLTEVRRMQDQIRQTERMAGVGELAASIAHEIRNPLGSIRGSVEILAAELSLDGHQQQLLELILKESARVTTIINDFLTFARLRPVHVSDVAMAEFLAEVALQIRQHVVAHGGRVDLETTIEPENLILSVDPEQMVQLILNLAINACEAMEYEGRLQLSVAVVEDGTWCELRVSDSGPGLDEDSDDHIFTPFFTTKKDGTGLGLPMVARIVHAHGGTVTTESTGNGTVFNVRLPVPVEEVTADEDEQVPGADAELDTDATEATQRTDERQPV